MPYSFKNQKIQMVYSFFLNSIGPTPASGPTKYTKCEDYLFLPAYICRLVEYQWSYILNYSEPDVTEFYVDLMTILISILELFLVRDVIKIIE